MPRHSQNVRYDAGPPWLVFADTEEGRRSGADIVGQAGGWCAPPASIEEAGDRLDASIAPGAVLVHLRGDRGVALDRLLYRLNLAAEEERYASVVLLPSALIDIATAQAMHGNVVLLVDPGRIEQEIAVGLAARKFGGITPRFNEERGAPLQLMRLSEEVSRIARTLAALSESEGQRQPGGTPMPAQADVQPPSAASVRAVIRARRLRDQFFDAALFADPAWDMLLDLLAARLEGRTVAVSSLCIAAAVPPTTALRWMKQLTDDGLLVRVADPADGRRVFIELSDAATAGLSAYFNAMARMGVTLP